MYPGRFSYLVPRSFDEAVAALAATGPDAKVLAGGCSLIPLMKLRLAEPRVLVDLDRIPGAAGIREEAGVVRLGAMTRQADVEASLLLRRRCPILPEASAVIADPTVRNMATVGGNVAHADPANDLPAVLLAADASFEVQGSTGMRTLPAGTFFRGLFETALAPDEVLTAILVPAFSPGTGSAYVKLERQVGDFAIAGAAVVLRAERGIVREAAIALTNLAPAAVRAPSAEALLAGGRLDARALDGAADAALDGLEPWDDLRGSGSYRLDAARTVVRRALERAAARASAGWDDPAPEGALA